MKKNQKKKQRKIFILFFSISLTIFILLVGTYAWFIGMSTVLTGDINVTISSTVGLELSLDGVNWENQVLTVNPSTIESIYSGNTNKYPSSTGLIPYSTNGMFSETSGRLIFYDKTSLGSSPGGYRLFSNSISNYPTEADGYFVFDLFIRNGTSGAYDPSSDATAAEDVYLTANSKALSIPKADNDVNYGVANSLRVGFFEIGRIKSENYNSTTLTGITCSGGDGITTSCSTTAQSLANNRGYTWNIWEPNNASHDSRLVEYFNNVCKKRNSTTGVYESTSCTTLTEDSDVHTYAINSPITSDNTVDIYDGINGYNSQKLTEMITYKTSDDANYSNDKLAFIKLAGNSVTKVRVYIWLEGQDIDNYDLVANDSEVRINFGLTKDKFALPN